MHVFVLQLTVLMDTMSLPVGLRPYLPLYLEIITESPISVCGGMCHKFYCPEVIFNRHTHTHHTSFSGHFPSKPELASFAIEFPNKGFGAKLYGRMPFLLPTSRNTLGFTFSASTRSPEVKASLPLCWLSNSSAPFFNQIIVRFILVTCDML